MFKNLMKTLVITIETQILFVQTFQRFIVAEDDFCSALELVCKPHPIAKNINKVINRWLSKVQKNPHCIAGSKSETIHNEDEGTFEVVTFHNGLRDGISITFLDQNLRFVSRITNLKVKINYESVKNSFVSVVCRK